jgi:hypothetical protein
MTYALVKHEVITETIDGRELKILRCVWRSPTGKGKTSVQIFEHDDFLDLLLEDARKQMELVAASEGT